MPGWKLRKAPKKDLYWVIDDTGRHYSNEPMTKEDARQQQKALYAAESRGEFKGGATASDATAAWESLPPPKKLSYETEDQYQKRLLRVKQQNERFASAGITPDVREGALTAQSKARELEALKRQLTSEAVGTAYERDPRIIAKRAEIARKEQMGSFFEPIVSGLVNVGSVVSQIPGLPSFISKPLGAVSDYLQGEQQQQQMSEAERAARQQQMEEQTRAYNEQLARQRLGAREALGYAPGTDIMNVDFQKINQQIAEQRRLGTLPMGGGTHAMPRFAQARYF